MQLLNMEVERRNSGDRVQVSALSPGLNAVCGRKGSGKTLLLRWLRAAVAPNRNGSDAPSYLSPGELNFREGDEEWCISRSIDGGSPDNRLVRHATQAWHRDSVSGHIVDGLNATERSALDHLLSISSQPGAVDRLWDAARALQLDNRSEGHSSVDHSRLIAREREITLELQALEGMASTREGLLSRKKTLDAELERVRREFRPWRAGVSDSDERRRLEQRLANYQTESQTVRDEIAELEAAIARIRGEILALETQGHLAQASAPKTYRQRLTDLDAQLARWRVTLSELRSHRERLETSATDAQLDRQLGDQLSPIPHADPRIALRTLEAQVLEARRNFDQVIEGYDRHRGEYLEGRYDLPSTLRTMQAELHEICQQLSRHEALSSGRELREQTLQLSRCESELRLSIERLIAERGELLREIATAYQLSVDQVAIAYDASCRCADHPKLEDWLLTQRIQAAGQMSYFDGNQYQSLVDELARLEARHKQAQSQLEEIQRHYREMDARLRKLGLVTEVVTPRGRTEADVLQDLDRVESELHRLDTRDRLRVELGEIRRQLERASTIVDDAHSLRGSFRRHWQAMGGHSVSSAANTVPAHTGLGRPLVVRHQLNGSHDHAHYEVLEEIALRLAIVERLATRSALVPLIFDETLDGLPGQLRQIAVHHLANVADSSKQQIIIMTDDEQVERSVRDARGNVVAVAHVRVHQQPVEKPDVNRHLLAVANDFEADKWNEPEWSPLPERAASQAKKRFVLTERSPIEDVPSIDRTTAARLRLLGVIRVENLLDSDAVQLSNQLDLEGVSAGIIQAWQAECRLLVANTHLRPFDARVLVGAGVHYPRQLEELEPSHLHDRVERFLATDRGRQIMRSGSPYELTRLTAWLASAKQQSSPQRTARVSRNEMERGSRPAHADSRHDRSDRSNHEQHHSLRSSTLPMGPRKATAPNSAPVEVVERRRPEGSRKRRVQGRPGSERKPAAVVPETTLAHGWKFFLELASPVVDAPSIGEKVSEQLANAGVETIEDLLASDADDLANALAIRRVNGDVVRDWQDQARLVCRIPNLRGHDAQLLVACNVTTPEALARMQPSQLLSQVTTIARSNEGQRILRGSQAPDLAEVTDWIEWAGHSRAILAA